MGDYRYPRVSYGFYMLLHGRSAFQLDGIGSRFLYQSFGVDYRVDTPAQLAAMFKAQQELGMKGGMLVTNPIPEQYAMDKAVIDAAIEQAVAESKEQGIHGKETTPFLLARVVELTGGDSLESNIQLVLNNAIVASKTAAELCK